MRAAPTLPLLLLAFGTAALAQTGTPQRAEQMRTEMHKRFGAADLNVDGRLTREEARGKMPWVYRNFDAIDSERNGAVTMEQIERHAVAQRAGRQAGNR